MENYEFWGTIATIVLAAVAIIGFVARGQENLRMEIREINSRLSSLEMRVSNLEQRVARLEGLFEGLRDLLRHRDSDQDE